MTTTPLEALLGRLDLQALGDDRFRGDNEPSPWGRLFGGMVAAQALVAATRTVPETHLAHSLHAYFLRAGDPEQDVELSVDRIRDGRSFITRRVVAAQAGKAIFNMSASFHVVEEGPAHATAMPQGIPDPETLPTWRELAAPVLDKLPPVARRRFGHDRPIDLRFTNTPTFLGGGRGEGPNHVWFRADGPLPTDPRIHRAVLAYASDMSLLDNIVRPHMPEQGATRRHLQLASLDHAVWFHRPDFNFEGWMLYAQDSPGAGFARGFTRGTIYAQDGTLVASVVQEGLLRPLDPAKASK